MARKAVASYLAARELDDRTGTEFLQRTCRLLLMILLARIDGKSPVEYISDPASKEWVRRFTARALLKNAGTLKAVSAEWYERIARR